jgi:hypothetical protein
MHDTVRKIIEAAPHHVGKVIEVLDSFKLVDDHGDITDENGDFVDVLKVASKIVKER